ncbi:hypothetical protein BDV26DRAFT_304886 [Aspergillus bertholletiae]|uniref:Transcription factor domain-containing protein n=1 Tax=Aspergillus bertholletiae TaxID=1226010 RepID=A0A5N7B7D2_9EURO|nr:hypothetical protein BDV26DRAFT_304886 [Aspergillus bertholletiae]
MAWMHNVVHLPTFREQCNKFLENGEPVNKFWLPLYYAMLSMTVYSTLPDVLLEFGIDDPQPLYQRLHRMSIEALFAVNFMAVHSVYSVQTICMLIHVGHNVGESDLIVTLMGSGIRIAQSLGLHRLGPDRPDLLEDIVDPQELTRKLIDREIGKRVWWFMIRQDWLQIPFLNTYTIHASQFNTPMPNKCPEDPRYLVQDGSVVDCNDDTYTQGSYTAVLNHVSVLIWKMQDRMLTLGHPGQSQDGLVKLYEEVIHADSELKKIMKHMPRFYREDGVVDSQLPPHIAQQRQAAMMSMAHKFFTVHRHFHVASFRNPWFSLTKLSCLPIARRSLSSLLSLPDNEYTWIVRNMWTVNTHTVTITVALLFDELFSPSDDTKMFDSADIETLARHCSSSLQEMCTRSEIAKKGVKILDFLLELNDAVKRGVCEEFNLEQIIAHVKGDLPRQDASQTDPHSLDLFDDMEWPSPGINTWESILDFIGCTD